MQATEQTDPHPSELLQSGDSLGRYQLLCPIARGGMGQVWAARQGGPLGLPKLVAIKTAIPIASKDYRQVEQYLFDEAYIAASIDHPNVCRILELGQERNVTFIAMEWLNGVPLSTLLSKVPQRRLDYRMGAHLVAQACSGLHAAHELIDDDGMHLEVVHRDATPHNLMITAVGELKVMDFGIVKSKNQQHQATQTGELKGKISYLTPEQLRGGPVDRRTDIFTLGCVLYVITVGKVAFNPDTDQDVGNTILRIINGEYMPPSAVLSDYPPELEAIVEKALATAPSKRFQTAEEMRLALESFLGDGSRSVSREDVAALLNEHCGPSIEKRRWEIRNAQKLFDSQSGEMRSGSYPVAEKSSNTSHTAQQQARDSSAAQWLQSSLSAATVRPSQHRRMPSLLVLLAAGLSLLTIGTYLPWRPASRDASSQQRVANATSQEQTLARAGIANAPSETQARATAPMAQASVESKDTPREAPEKAAGAASMAKRIAAHRTTAKAADVPTEKRSAATEASPTLPSNDNPPTQTVSRKPPRHAIDESDPFEK